MHLRSGYVTPSDFEEWWHDPEDYYSESDTCGKRKQQKKRDTKMSAPAAVRSEGLHQTQLQVPATEEVPSWVPARLPSCVPGPRLDASSAPQAVAVQQALPSQDVNNNYQISNSNQNRLPIMDNSLLQPAQMPANLLNTTGSQNTFAGTQPQLPWIFGDNFHFAGNGFSTTFQPADMKGMAGSHLPILPLGVGGNPFLDFGFQSPLPLAAPDSKLSVSY